MQRWTIYCHTHIESGRCYIGLTSQTMEKRWNEHVTKARSSNGGRWHFPNAIRKYGKNAFSHEVLAMSWDLEGANATELIIIEQEDTRNPEKGFNLAKGGGSQPNPIRRNPWDRPEYREKCSQNIKFCQTPSAKAASRAAQNTPESKQKRSLLGKQINGTIEARARNSRVHTGVIFTEKHKEKISRNMIILNAAKSPEERRALTRKAYAAKLARVASFTQDEAAHARAVRSEASKKSGVAAALKTELAINNHRIACRKNSKYANLDMNVIIHMLSSGLSKTAVAKNLRIDRGTLHDALKRSL